MNTTPFRDGSVPGGESGTGIMLFGVRLMEGSPSSSSSFRKSASMNNLTQLDHAHDSVADVAVGYASDDLVHASGRSRERKRGENLSDLDNFCLLYLDLVFEVYI